MARKPVGALAALAITGLAACAGPATPPAAQQTAAVPDAPACRVGPDGRRPDMKPATTDRGLGGTGQMADRGLGGTGKMADRGLGGTGQMADRGLGGTGKMADRGLGGTGIVGTITGFASVCVNGVEVAFDEAAPVLVDGARQTTDALLAGQVAVIAAEPSANGLRARSVAVRHEVTGPVQSVGPDGLVVAGQRVRTGKAAPAVGSWVSVSGLRDPEGTIHASRIDPAAPGVITVTVSGPLERDGGTVRIGALRLRGGGALPVAGTPVTVSGTLQGRVLVVHRLALDPVLPDRTELGRFLLQTYARRDGDALLLGPGLRASLGPGFDPPDAEQPAVLVLEVNPQGGLVATGTEGRGGEAGSSAAESGSGHGPGAAEGGHGAAGGHGSADGQGGHGASGGEGEQSVGIAVQRLDVGNVGTFGGKGAGLVEKNRGQAGGGLQRLGVADEDAVAGRDPQRHRDHRRSGKPERAGAGYHQHRHRRQNRGGGIAGDQPPAGQGQRRRRRDEAGEPAGYAVGEALDARLGGLGMADEGDHPPQHRLRPHRGGADDEHAVESEGAAGDGVAGAARSRHGLAADHRLIHRRPSGFDRTVHRDALAGAYPHQIAATNALQRHALLAAVGTEARRQCGAQGGEGSDRPAGSPPRPRLQPLAGDHQRDHQRRRLELGHPANDKLPESEPVGGAGAEGDQNVHVGAAAPQSVPGTAVEAGTGPELDRSRQQRHQPAGQRHQHVRQQRQAERRRGGEDDKGTARLVRCRFGGVLLRQRPGAEPGPLHRRDEIDKADDGGIERHFGPFRRQADHRRHHPRPPPQHPFQPCHASGATHAGNGENGAGGGGAVSRHRFGPGCDGRDGRDRRR